MTFGGQPTGSPAPAAAGDLIKDSNTQSFMQDVIEASRQQPVIVDFWAPWCGPCKQLGPALEKVVKAANGKVRMVKINVDENQQLAQQMRIQSIPAVYAFVNGQPVDGFMGALPEGQIKQFVDRLGGQGSMAEEIEAVLADARALEAEKDHQHAAQLFAQLLQVDRENVGAIAGLVRCEMALGDLENAQKTLALVPPAKAGDPEVLSVKAQLELALNPVDTSEIGALKAKVEANPDDFQARLELAVLLNGANEREAATDQLIYVIKKMRAWNDEAARKQLVKFFEAWGPKDEFTLAGRRKLSSVLFS
ncbi:thioredoxin [Aestuariivirga litoralis]|uniref:Thioredoxin n=1 Tax=Aestuariivirga litoralis TaxID=2650924 RepID=A0A2W2BBP7_9HYPH|nr:thioredoxin [Aestuariivirga litoralis]PZF77588.1 thioredoxin [Aestuariivirga litoralis]